MAANLLLNSIPRSELAAFEDQLERTHLQAHDLLIEPHRRIPYIHFPQTCMVSLVIPLSNGSSIEAATVGNEGVIGISLVYGIDSANIRAICQLPGEALRMRTDAFARALEGSAGLRVAVGLYTNALLGMVAQGSACNALHTIEQRLARWFLTFADRVSNDEFSITQEFLAQMLGTYRPTVTNAAGELQEKGLISYRHGNVKIVDRSGLELVTCECYDLIRGLYDETFEQVPVLTEKLESRR